jgi:hypothetical protein
MARDGLAHPLASDDTGIGLVAAVRKCLGNRWDISQVPYVHGASDGDAMVTAFECNAIRQALWPGRRRPPDDLAGGLLRPQQRAGRLPGHCADPAHDAAR